MCAEIGGNNRSRGMSEPHPYVTPTYKCSTVHGISQMIFDGHTNLKYKYGRRNFGCR